MRPRKKIDGEGRQLSPEQAAAAAMVAEARARGLELTGPNGLLKLFTKNVLETALNEETTEHLGHEKNQAEPGRESTNVRNGARSKTVVSDAAGEAMSHRSSGAQVRTMSSITIPDHAAQPQPSK
ncbi:MAG TPA: transposase [Pilimelia sp.]|nr:transposase [Pilimelia sp.]